MKFIDNKIVIICLYVDDMLIFGIDLDILINTKKYLSSCFAMKDMGNANVILSIKLIKNRNDIVLT